MSSDAAPQPNNNQPRTLLTRFLDGIEWLGNKLPDPVVLFLLAMLITWAISAMLAPVTFTEIDPRTVGVDATGKEKTPQPIEIKNQLSGDALTLLLTRMVREFATFPPLGLVLVAMLGVGVAEHVGFINALLKSLLQMTPNKLLTPMLLIVAIASHTAVDAGYVLVIPLGGVIFATAGRHPLAGIVCAFAGVSGGFSANFVPSGLDALLQGFTEPSARLVDPTYEVSMLCNYIFMSASCLLIVGAGWYLTDRIIEPRLRGVEVDGDPDDMPKMDPMTPAEWRGLWAGLLTFVLMAAGLVIACWPEDSPLRAPDGSLTIRAPLIDAIVPLIFLFALIPAIVYGYVAGTVKNHRDIVKGMSKSMSAMGYYLVLAFFAAMFTYAFRESNLGALLAIKGADFLASLNLSPQLIIVGIILLAAFVNLIVGSASAKWALLGPIFVPMLMSPGLGLTPELTQAAYRIGDSSTNIITPLMPYFPLVVLYAQRYVKNTGIGTLIALMLPFSLCFLFIWIVLLLIFWQLGLPLGIPTTVGYELPTGM